MAPLQYPWHDTPLCPTLLKEEIDVHCRCCYASPVLYRFHAHLLPCMCPSSSWHPSHQPAIPRPKVACPRSPTRHLVLPPLYPSGPTRTKSGHMGTTSPSYGSRIRLRMVWVQTGPNDLVFVLGQFGLGSNGLRLLTVSFRLSS
jgi:hypothetical protein